MTDFRRKAASKPAPSSAEEARHLIARYAELQENATAINAVAADELEELESRRQAALAPIDAEMTDLFNALRAWWAVAGAVATEGKRKSIVLAGCQIGERTTTPALAVPDDRCEGAIIADLLARPGGAGDYVLTRHALYRPSLIKTLRAGDMHPDYALLASGAGLGISQREEFFIDVAASSAIGAHAGVQ
jgi:phage host-nuclease inhibitor protein Gam